VVSIALDMINDGRAEVLGKVIEPRLPTVGHDLLGTAPGQQGGWITSDLARRMRHERVPPGLIGVEIPQIAALRGVAAMR
jgi:hypothetical protein